MTEKPPRSVVEPKNPRLNASRRANLPHVPGIRVGDYIFLSGMTPIDPQTGERNHGPIAEQIRTTLSNMQHMLESAGSHGLVDAASVRQRLRNRVRGVGELIGTRRRKGRPDPSCLGRGEIARAALSAHGR